MSENPKKAVYLSKEGAVCKFDKEK